MSLSQTCIGRCLSRIGASARDFKLPNSRKWDLLAAAPIIVWSALAVIGFTIQIHRQWPKAGLENGLLILSEMTSALFFLMQIIMLAVRKLPRLKAQGLAPRIWAFVGANFVFLLLLLPRNIPSAPFALLSIILVLSGTSASVVVLMFLGEGFAILPQARVFRMGGPYRFVRHPLYLAEQISALGVAMQFEQPWSMLIVLAGFAAQFPRMHYEEKIMAKEFPGYQDYALRTARIIPFLY